MPTGVLLFGYVVLLLLGCIIAEIVIGQATRMFEVRLI